MYKQPRPILRDENYADLQSSIRQAIDKFIKSPQTIPYRNCLNCSKWDFEKDQCKLYNAKPPTEIIVYSCPSYVDGEDIPF
jgi:hypothetical protein